MRRSVVLMMLLGLAVALSAAAVASWVLRRGAEPSPPASASPPNELFLDEFPPTERGRPIFVDVREVTIHRTEPTEGRVGVPTRVELDESRVRQVVACLEQTRELSEPLKEPSLEDVVLFEIADRYGERMFELSSDHVIVGGRHRWYWSPCLSSFATP